MIPAASIRPFVAPPAVGIAEVGASVVPSASKSWNHVAGGARGGTLTYADRNAYTWWAGGGFLTLNRGHRGIRRTHRGAEDVAQVQK
ncbi:hypothetical protein [Oceanithermus sp.]|uniref:hypothetical protein n=1 Tax=Oceanithermus sp. TaxID=2268145 RepID=UPI002579CE28|nr:hypothetical protein [Oceanithermus sp.]